MIAESAFYGGAKSLTTGVASTLNFSTYRVHVVTTTSAPINIKLQSARQLKTGGPIGLIVNAGSNSFNIVDNSNNLLVALPAGNSAELALLDNTTAAGSWIVHDGNATSAPGPGASPLLYAWGCFTSAGGHSTAMREYSPTPETWLAKSPLPNPPSWTTTEASYGSAAVFGTRAFLFGTYTTFTDTAAYPRLIEYDPDTYAFKTSCPFQLTHCLSASLASDIVTFTGNSLFPRQTYSYNVAGDSWTLRARRSSTRQVDYTPGDVNNGKAILTHGQANAVDSYSLDAFTVRTNRPAPTATQGSATSDSSTVYVYGGDLGSSALTSTYGYQDTTNAWTSRGAFPDARYDTGTCHIDGYNYILGGQTYTSPFDTNTLYEQEPVADVYLLKTTPSPAIGRYGMNQCAAVTP